ncbi:MAG: hypothetical protein LAP40_02590 [Acidobacteriia bacterium]|nr:hypothetical protein [Terriglobia bacterium]
MLPSVPGPTQQYLADLQRMNQQLTDVSQQLSSGFRVNSVADDPFAVAGIMQAQSRIGQLTQSQTNLNNLKAELETGDSALQQSMQNVESALSIASQATSLSVTPAARTALATQVQGILENLVKLSSTTSNGRYIFSGDLDQQGLYTLDATQPTGARQLATATSTRVVTDANGAQIWLGKTASEIFDARNPDSSAAPDNVFGAVNSLLIALNAGDTAGVTASITSLKAADDHLNQELGYYGIGQARVTDSLDSASKSLITVQETLSGLRDTNMANAAVELNQLSVQQQAALSARSKINGMNLFDFMA